MRNSIAIVGMACRYPDAATPDELWENVLAQRQAFRRLPPERLNLDDYWASDRAAPDRTYAQEAAVIEGYDFDRVHFRVVGSTFRSADLVHWLALDVANQSLTDAGFPNGMGLPHDATGVLLGNTLTGEFSRANVMRLRWPYVRRVIDAALREEGWTAEQRQSFAMRLEERYKAPFPPIGEESLAGGLSNTIAGRICNYFDLHGGGYTIDGACSSSLLAVSSACSALVAGDLDVALAGGVDLSLDPFELIGFAKTSALASTMMRVYDAQSAGFWPGEGCGIVVLMREADAIRQQRRIYGVIQGWGVSSDGNGGITRPEAEGQLLAIRRAYSRAGVGIETVAYFEGHGTGTSVGDATELRALNQARRDSGVNTSSACIGSIKANIGHTKAASGVAGLIKAVMALYTQIVPPTTGCQTPHAELTGDTATLHISARGQLWPEDQPLRAGISSMGFGGINTHLVLEGKADERRSMLTPTERMAIMTAQDAELFVFSASDRQSLQQQVARVLQRAPHISYAELTDLAAEVARSLKLGLLRAAVVAGTPAELTARLELLQAWLAAGTTSASDPGAQVWLDEPIGPPRIGFLFPGQGSPSYVDGGALRRRFAIVDEIYADLQPQTGDAMNTAVAQPAIVRASLSALRVLRHLDITAQIAVGHSLGELSALYWAGGLDSQTVLRVASVRGQAMAELGASTGAMASLGAGKHAVNALIGNAPVVIAGLNAPKQTVIAGDAREVMTIVERARAQQVRATLLPVSHAFHSPLVKAAATPLRAHLETERFYPLRRAVVSTVTGTLLDHKTNLRDLLYQQVVQPVRFMEASRAAAMLCDLLIEVGPGQVLSHLAGEFLEVPALAMDVGGPSLRGLLAVAGAAFVKGAPVRVRELFADRLVRPFDLDRQPRFFVNPCELAPRMDETLLLQPVVTPEQETLEPAKDAIVATTSTSTFEVLNRLIAQRAELPPEAIRQEHHLLNDLHLNSISTSQIVVEAVRALGLQVPVTPTDYANATVGQLTQALDELRETGESLAAVDRIPQGVDLWIRPFQVVLVERARRARTAQAGGTWTILAPDGHPLAERLEQAFAQARQGQGIVVCLPLDMQEQHIGLLLDGAQKMLAHRSGTFVVVQHGGGGAPLARTLHLEAPAIDICVVDVPVDQPEVNDWIVAEALAARGYSEVHYDAHGRRREPLLQLLPLPSTAGDLPLDPSDVLLVTGGGKGITAECALALAQKSGVKLALLGRSKLDSDLELMMNMQRMRDAGLHVCYVAVDITDADAVVAAVRECEAKLGPITGILHGAARNEPQLIEQLDETMIRRTFAPKLDGLRNLLTAVDCDRLRVLITFGSIIARTGLRGEADYALANDWLARMTERFAAEHPLCRCLAIEWSLWSGVGMGERLGRVAALRRDGITPIPPDIGIDLLQQLLAQPLPTVAVVVTGRFGNLPTLQVAQPELPFLRFLEHPQVMIGGVELVVDATLSSQNDPYLEDHVFRGERLLPAVMGLEAMSQVIAALTGSHVPPLFEDIQLERPIVVPAQGTTTIRIAGLVRQPGIIDVSIRSEETAFRVDHFRARGYVVEEPRTDHGFDALLASQSELLPVPLDPARELYGGLFFHSGRFQRLRSYQQLSAKTCVADIAVDYQAPWFGRYFPQTMLLGDAGARDATIHTIQACIPQAVVLPIGVDRLEIYPDVSADSWISTARERSHDGMTFTYDVEVHTEDGTLRERWQGLRLRIVGDPQLGDDWPAALFGPYLERRLAEIGLHPAPAIALELNAVSNRQHRGEQAVQRLLGRSIAIHHRPDGKPLLIDGPAVSLAHGEMLTLAVVGTAPLACDLELVQPRGLDLWQALLGEERFALIQQVVHTTADDEATAATRLWAAGECLIKAGLLPDQRLHFMRHTVDGWVLFASETLTIATVVVRLRGCHDPVVLAVLHGPKAEQEREAAMANVLAAQLS